VHRRPLGRGRLLATIGALVVLVGCVLPWYSIGGALSTGLPAETINAFSDKGIVVFICALLVLALVSLPYAAGDKPLALDRALSYVIVIVVAIGAYAWRTIDFILSDPVGLRPDLAPGWWMVGVGLIILARATYEISSEHRF
jgi:hypothetical protein